MSQHASGNGPEGSLLPCFNQITCGRQPPADAARDLAAIRAGGWRAVELWLRHWDTYLESHTLASARRLVDEAGLVVAGGCAQPGYFFGDAAAVREGQDALARRLEQCQAFGAPHLVVTPGPGPERPAVSDLDRAAERLRAAGELAAGYGVRLGLEFLKGLRFVNNLPAALMLAERVRHPNVGVLVDTFHLYAGLSKVEDLDLLAQAPGMLYFIHVNDVPAAAPRELWTDADRVLPGEGAFPLEAMLRRMRRAGYRGPVSLELFNAEFAARWAENPVAASGAAYRSLEPILSRADG